MAWDADLYQYWHDGDGVQIFNIGASTSNPFDQPLWIKVGGAGGMRAWAAHAVFAAILLSSIAIRERAADALPDSERLEPAIVHVAGSHRLGPP